jgi:anti-anti-sigma factor
MAHRAGAGIEAPCRASVDVIDTVEGDDVTVTGCLDVRTTPDVRARLHDAIDCGTGPVHVHLADAEIGDATGLGVLVGAHARARRAGRDFVLVDTSERTDRLLRASRLNRVLLPRM